MQQEKQTGDRSLLLDYITPIFTTSLFRAGKAKHWIVVAAIFGTISLQILVVLSTGLLVSTSTMGTRISQDGKMLTRFDPENLKMINTTAEFWTTENSKPWDLYFATSGFKMAFPHGTTSEFAYQQFDFTTSTNNTVAALVEVFSADLTCEPAQVTHIDSSPPDKLGLWAVSSHGCSSMLLTPWTRTPGVDVVAKIEKCPNLGDGDSAMRLAFLAGDFTLPSMNPEIAAWNMYRNYTATICVPSYQILEATVTFRGDYLNDSTPSLSVVPSPTPSTLDNLTAWDIARLIPYTFCSTHVPMNDHLCLSILAYWNASLLFLDVLNVSNPQVLASDFQDITILIQSATAFFRSWTAQLATLYLVTPIDQPLALNITTQVDRLHTKALSIWLSEAALLIAVLSSLYLVWQSPCIRMSRDPSSIGGLATVLVSSPTVVQRLTQKATVLDDKSVREKMAAHTFSLQLDLDNGSAKLEVSTEPSEDTSTGVVQSASTEACNNKTKSNSPFVFTFFIPWAVSKTGMLCMVLAPLCVVAGLEILYRYSLAHEGIATITSPEYVHYAWSLLPALVMTGIKLLCGSLGSVVMTFQPFHAFQKGQASTRLGLLDNYSAQTALQVISTAASKRQFAAMAVAVSSIVAPFLTIFVSGLFGLRNLDGSLDLQIPQIDQFNDSMAVSAKAEGTWWRDAILIVENSNTSFRYGTYDNLAFPQLDLHEFMQVLRADTGNQTESGPRLHVTVPSLRGNVNCTVFKPDQIFNARYHSDGIVPIMALSAIPPIQDCDITPPKPDLDFWPFTGENASWYADFAGNYGYVGNWWDLESAYSAIESNTTYHDQKPGCPRAFTFFAKIYDNESVDIEVFYCSPYVEKLDVEVTYTYPDLQIDPGTPPVPHEDTAEYFSDTMITSIEFFFAPIGPPGANVTWADRFFYLVVMFGRNAVDPESIVGDANRDELYKAINRLYGQLTAVFLNTQRLPLNTSIHHILHNATISGVPRTRLFQHVVSTRILQGLLILMTLCSITAFITMDTRHILPVNPNSIAGVASLLAGADMLDRRIIPESAEWMSDTELHDVFEGYLFSLGRFGEGEKTRFGIDIGQALPVEARPLPPHLPASKSALVPAEVQTPVIAPVSNPASVHVEVPAPVAAIELSNAPELAPELTPDSTLLIPSPVVEASQDLQSLDLIEPSTVVAVSSSPLTSNT